MIELEYRCEHKLGQLREGKLFQGAHLIIANRDNKIIDVIGSETYDYDNGEKMIKEISYFIVPIVDEIGNRTGDFSVNETVPFSDWAHYRGEPYNKYKKLLMESKIW